MKTFDSLNSNRLTVAYLSLIISLFSEQENSNFLKSSVLSLKTRTGVVVFVDNPKNGESFRKFEIVSYENSICSWIVRENLFEGRRLYILSSNSGKQQLLYGIPVFNSKSNYFCSAYSDWPVQDSENGLQVWKYTGGEPEINFEIKNLGFSSPRWMSETRFSVKVISVISNVISTNTSTWGLIGSKWLVLDR